MIMFYEEFNKDNIKKLVAQALQSGKKDALAVYDKSGKPLLVFAVENHFKNLASLIIENSNTALFQSDEDGNCALHVAVEFEEFGIAQKIIEKNPQTMRVANYYHNMTPFHIAAQKNLVGFGKFMLAVDPRIIHDEVDDDCYNRAIHVCGEHGCTEFAQMLASINPQVLNFSNYFGQTAEDLAIENGHLKTAEILHNLQKEKRKD